MPAMPFAPTVAMRSSQSVRGGMMTAPLHSAIRVKRRGWFMASQTPVMAPIESPQYAVFSIFSAFRRSITSLPRRGSS